MVDSKWSMTIKQLLVVSRLILMAFYQLHVNLVWFTPYRADASKSVLAGQFFIINYIKQNTSLVKIRSRKIFYWKLV